MLSKSQHILLILLAILLPACTKSPADRVFKSPSRTLVLFVVGNEYTSPSIVDTVATTYQQLYGPRLITEKSTKEPKHTPPEEGLKICGLNRCDDLVALKFNKSEIILTHFNVVEMTPVYEIKVPISANLATDLTKALTHETLDLSGRPRCNPLQMAIYLEGRKDWHEALAVYKDQHESQGVVFLQEINSIDKLSRKVRELERIVARIDEAESDAIANYSFNFEFDRISVTNQQRLQQIVTKMNLENYCRSFSRKPVVLRLAVDKSDKAASLLLKMRFNRDWYQRALVARPNLPKTSQGLQLLHFTPYYELMRKIGELRASYLKSLESAQVDFPEDFYAGLLLTKLYGEEVEIPIVLDNRGDIMEPYRIRVNLEGYQENLIEAGNLELFHRRGYFALGPVSTISGDRTQWGLIADFFGLTKTQ